MFNAVVFDMDGVIFDSEIKVLECWRETAEKYGIADIENLCRKCLGLNREAAKREFLEYYGYDFPYDAYKTEMSNLFHERYGNGRLPLKLGVVELLEYLKAGKIRIALASSTRFELVKRELSDAGIIKYFDAVIGGDMVERSKPAPDIFLKACEQLGVRPEDTYGIEDSYNGIRALSKANIRAIMVPDMAPATDEMKSLSYKILPSLFEVKDFFMSFHDRGTIDLTKEAALLMNLAKDTIIVRFRFLDAAISKLRTEAVAGLGGYETDGEKLMYDPELLLREYLEEPNIAVRLYLHVLLHCIFLHRDRKDKANENYWNLATDIAVENTILEFEMPSAALSRDDEAIYMLQRLKKNVKKITAEHLYRDFMVHGLSEELEDNLKRLFTIDCHDSWRKKEVTEEYIVTKEQWEEIARRIKTDIGTFSKGKTDSEGLANSIDEATRDRYNYRKILQRFMVSGEELTVNDDEFDYIYYTYGLTHYGNMPLIEPLEYKEQNKIREFVIAIDTSASCNGEIVKQFVQKTYEILKDGESFFHQINVHIIQCDNEVRQDTKITNDAEFREFIDKGKIVGFGSTDFRPVFDYVNELKENGSFTNLKGLIYFTDGYGIYPERMPDYDVIFAFLNEDEQRQAVPGWAIKVIMEDEINEYK